RGENLLPAQIAILRTHLTNSDLLRMSVADFARLRLVCESLRFPTLITLAEAPETAYVRALARLSIGGLVLPGADVSADQLGAQVQALREELEKTPIKSEDRGSVAIGGLVQAGGQMPEQHPTRREPQPEPEPDEE